MFCDERQKQSRDHHPEIPESLKVMGNKFPCTSDQGFILQLSGYGDAVMGKSLLNMTF
jgi:hypothetical protein